MENSTMGKVLVEARIENLHDLFKLQDGTLSAEAVHTVSVENALVDTGATLLHIPKSLIGQLNLEQVRTRSHACRCRGCRPSISR